MNMTPEQVAMLRAPFAAEAIGKLPRGGAELDFVGHAAVVDRLLAVDPGWSWEPFSVDEKGCPTIVWAQDRKEAWMWGKLTVCGVTRIECGTCSSTTFDVPKQLISDFLRRAAMRFGVALDLWSRQELHGSTSEETAVLSAQDSVGEGVGPVRGPGARPAAGPGPVPPLGPGPVSAGLGAERTRLKSFARSLPTRLVADVRKERGLPTIDRSDETALLDWETALAEVVARVERESKENVA